MSSPGGSSVSASYAATASYVENAQTASYVENAQTASYVTLSQTASYYSETDPVFVAKSASLATTGSNTFTGDQTITLTGDVTGSGTGSFATILANSGVIAGSYGSATQVPAFTVDSKGRITSVSNVTITGGTNGYLLQTNGSGGLSWIAPPSTSTILNGNSNVSIPTSGGNVNTSVNGNANILVVTGTGANVNGTFTNGDVIQQGSVTANSRFVNSSYIVVTDVPAGNVFVGNSSITDANTSATANENKINLLSIVLDKWNGFHDKIITLKKQKKTPFFFGFISCHSHLICSVHSPLKIV